jgi:membrane-bound serine protease (ClpP class)
MECLINPNLAYMLVVASVILLMLTNINPKSTSLRVGVVLCFVATGIELVFLEANLWALLMVVLSPLPFFIAVRQAHTHNPLFLISIFILTISSVFLFVDQNNRPVVNVGLAGFVSTMYGAIIWITTEGIRNADGARLSNDPNSVVGLIGETQMEIEPFSAGSVLVEGELWQARSKNPIPAGNTVRVLRQDGFWLTVKKVEKLTKG